MPRVCSLARTRPFPALAALVSLIACAFVCVQEVRAAITLDFVNVEQSQVSFSGGTFSFYGNGPLVPVKQFLITGVHGGTGDAVGLDGRVDADSDFTIGTISGSTLQTAPVTETGTLHIRDALATELTGTIQWDYIATFGAGGILNLNGTVNLTGITYSGANSDLSALAQEGSASDVVTFQFVPAQTLTQLKDTGGSTSYSGSITAVPEPSTLALSVAALISVLLVTRRSGRS